MKSFECRRQNRTRTIRVGAACLLAFTLTGCASDGGQVTIPPPSAAVTRSQAWRDAEALTARDPARITVIGSGASMRPVYGENTVLVLQRVPFSALAAGMNVAYWNQAGRLVVHRLVALEDEGWRVRGLNNQREDDERVTPENLQGVVYAAFANNEVR